MNRLAQKALLLGVPGTCPETFLCCFFLFLFLFLFFSFQVLGYSISGDGVSPAALRQV